MSLLLDALKRAAEQKARRAEVAEETRSASDDTVMLDETETYIVAQEDSTDIFDSDPTVPTDETLISSDNTEIVEDQTEVFEDDPTLAFAEDPTEVIQEDETVVFQEDETQALEDSTAIIEEETEVVIIDTGDDTVQPSFDEDETMSLLSNDDVSQFLGDFYSQPNVPLQQSDTASSPQLDSEDEMFTFSTFSDFFFFNLTLDCPSESTTGSCPLLPEGFGKLPILDDFNLEPGSTGFGSNLAIFPAKNCAN
jgi:hypothetical protein